MRNSSAFTLIELLIYLVLLSILTLLTFSFASRTYRFMLERTRANHFFIRSVITGDLIRRDIQVASQWQKDWDVSHGVFKQLIMGSNGKPVEQWVGYTVNSKGLHRYEGSYVGAGKWLTSTGSLVDTQVTKIILEPIIHGKMIIAVKVFVTNRATQPEPIIVALRNRVLL